MKRAILFFITVLSKVVILAQPVPIDYSYCGYRLSEVTIPEVPSVLYVKCQEGDCSPIIQEALDFLASKKPDKLTGFRGAILLSPGTFELSSPLWIKASGIVLRGSGVNQTILHPLSIDRSSAIYIEGTDDCAFTDTTNIDNDFIKSGEMSLKAQCDLHKGDNILIYRPSTISWIQHLGCENFGGGKDLNYWGWHEGDIDIIWDREVTDVNDTQITINVPLTTSIDQRYGGGKIIKYNWPGRITDCGVENLTIDSKYNKERSLDEDHCWNGVYISNARDCWVRQINFTHLAGSAVVIQRSADRVTVEDCRSYEPISELGGMRRRTFYTLGGMNLFQRCYSEDGINDFSAGFCAPGPNAFVQCEAKRAKGFSGSIGSWATGLLFDCVTIDGNDIKFRNLELEKYGAGWNTANSTMWQCSASGIHCYNPDEDNPNSAIGCWGQMWGNGIWKEPNEHVKPWSLFQDLLSKRLGHDVSQQCRILDRKINDGTTSPTIEQAISLSNEARHPIVTLEQWIAKAPEINTDHTKSKVWKSNTKKTSVPLKSDFRIENGHLTKNGQIIVGGKHDSPWWNGRLRYTALPKATYALTRFVPGNEGWGLTDRIDSVVAQVENEHIAVFAQNYGLWYDRRRDDHERVRRTDGDVWGPFYEQPFARSGISTAWDGLSRYDLTKDNPWYQYRLQQFADKTSSKGIVLLLEHYFQHNILEAGAHWVDCPWREVNNINSTSFPEPVPFAGDKRIFIAEQFYDVSNDTLANLHKQYICRQLNAFKDNTNVIHSIGAEYTGPLCFVQFWIDCILEWTEKTGIKPIVMLKANKDVQDSILADPIRSKAVDIIAIEQWYHHDKGLYAPEGGVNMAPRQYLRKIKTGNVGYDDVYQSVHEYRIAYPDKAVAYFGKNYPQQAWAIFMAGGSLAGIPVKDEGFLRAAVSMQSETIEGCHLLYSNNGYIIDGKQGVRIPVADSSYNVFKIDKNKGELFPLKSFKGSFFEIPSSDIYWLSRK